MTLPRAVGGEHGLSVPWFQTFGCRTVREYISGENSAGKVVVVCMAAWESRTLSWMIFIRMVGKEEIVAKYQRRKINTIHSKAGFHSFEGKLQTMRVSVVRQLAVITWYCRYNYVHFKQNIFRGVLGSKQNCVEGTENFKSSLYIWKFSIHVPLKPSLKDFELYLDSVWNERICVYAPHLPHPFIYR